MLYTAANKKTGIAGIPVFVFWGRLCEIFLDGAEVEIHALEQTVQSLYDDADAADAVTLYVDGQERIMQGHSDEEPAIAVVLSKDTRMPS